MDLYNIILAVGYLGLFFIIFAESGLLIGIFFPGDSLLFTAGLLATQGYFEISWLIVLFFLAAVSGDSVGYTFGRRLGKKFFKYEKSFWFRPDNIAKARAFYAKYGAKTIILARFVPGVRTLAPILAGVGDMKYITFIVYNILGGLLWAVGVTALGYYLGNVIPNVEMYLLPLVAVIILVSFLPVGIELLRDQERRHSLARKLEAWRRQWLKF
ncbi:MAG: VTT domain-containing protein [Candidatus Kerfeldbacteria bacterium]|nr:VTT domain-containing protein [Candidatus Kerfeldbacteria bacterium]